MSAMQPPPPAASVGGEGPHSQNAYRQHGPFRRRANAPFPPAAGPPQPVTDPFAFAKQVPSPGVPRVTHGFAPQTFSPQPVTHPHPQGVFNPHGPHPSPPALNSGAHSAFSNMAVPSQTLSENNRAGMPPTTEPGMHRPPSQTYSPGPEHAFTQGPQTVRQQVQAGAQPLGQPYCEHSAPNYSQPAVSAFQPVPPQATAQNRTQVPPVMSHAPGVDETQSTFHNTTWQNPGNPWQGPFSQEHFYLQPLGTTNSFGHPPTQDNNPSIPPQVVPEAASGQCPTEADSGTVSMFFKGDEAENEEILSTGGSGHVGTADSDAFPHSVGHTYYQPLHALQVHEGQSNALPPAKTQQMGLDMQQPTRPTFGSHDLQAHPSSVLRVEDQAAHEPQFENVENMEYVQNQEVLPSELLAQSALLPVAVSESYQAAAVLGPGASHMEGGPNLEAPDSLPQPVRPDSVSSSYSTLSHRSTSSSVRPQEQGTFIQQESGRPEEDSSEQFFKQVDSSPLDLASEPNRSNYHHGGLSQALTPSPPKPVGVFQTSVNSSFEPVKSHGLGPKPAGVDQAKMVEDLREDHAHRKSTKKSPAAPVCSPGNLEQPPDNLETIFMPQSHPLPLTVASGGSVGVDSTPEKRRLSARVEGAMRQCESPATTLWASNELPDFGGNVMLAPAAPAVYVPARQTVQVVQPPDEGLPPDQQPNSVLPPPPTGNLSSENLENPPKVGEEEPLSFQANSGYATLLSSPPTEALQNQPILIAQSNQSLPSAPPVHFPLSNLMDKNDAVHLAQDPGIGHHPLLGLPSGCAPSSENVLLSAVQPGSLLPSTLAVASSLPVSQGGSPNLPVRHSSQQPLNLAPEGPKADSLKSSVQPNGSGLQSNTGPPLAPPAGLMAPSNNHSSIKTSERIQALDYTVGKTSEQSGLDSGSQAHNQLLSSGLGLPPPALHAPVKSEEQSPQHFYQQITQDVQPPDLSGRATPLEQPQVIPSPAPQVPLNQQRLPGGSPALAPGQPPLSYSHPVNAPGSTGLPSTPAPAGTSTHTSGTPSQQGPQYPQVSQVPNNAFGPPPNSYGFYYRAPYPYSAYQPPYQPPYPPPSLGPRTARHYYQEDAYNRYDPRYSQYDNSGAYVDTGDYRYGEPERPSSRASHTSDRSSSRQRYPEDYYGAKNGWAEYYAAYYANQPDYGDSSRYSSAYASRYRDPREYDPQYWYDTDQNPYQKREAYGNSRPRYDPWQYDPRSAGSFDDDLEPRHDTYGDDFDRRSVHSEHSGHSLRSNHSFHSRQSSFSSRSQQSQLYHSNHDLRTSAYDVSHQPPSLHAEYSYTGYAYENQPPFTDYSYSSTDAWPAAEQVPPRPLTPEKFSMPHVCARFGPGGHLIKVLPNLPSEGQPALVELHSMETITQKSPEQEEIRAFPGPLTKEDTHKVDVINFAQKKAARCAQDDTLLDKESARLLWEFVVLLCRQNGTVVGTDIAELLLQDHKTAWLPGKSPDEINLIDFTDKTMEQAEEESVEAQLSFLTDSHLPSANSLEKETERFRELLLYGRKKDALELAMKHGLWGHALLLASKMDSRTHAKVMTRFANSLPINDPLQTVYQLMSGRMPAASMSCGDEKWGDWRPHLAMILSNVTNNLEVELRSIISMGDTLASKGLLDAAHFCYLVAQVTFGVYTKKSSKLVLIGSDHSLSFCKFVTNEAIQRTEAYEYARSLGTQPYDLPNFQAFKFIYACRLAETGLTAQAFHYCEVISRAILRSPSRYSPVLVSQLIEKSSQLRFSDPLLKENPEQELFIEPSWLVQLRKLDGKIKEGSVIYSPEDVLHPQQYPCSTPNSELEKVGQSESTETGQEVNSGDNLLLAPLLPIQSVQLMPSAPPTILSSSTTTMPSSQPDPAGSSVPFYPVAPSSPMAPTLPGLGSGISNLPDADRAPVYPGAAVPSEGLPSQRTDHQPHELKTSQEAVLPRDVSYDSPDQKAAKEPQTEDFYGKMASMGYGRRSRTTSESSVRSHPGRERHTSAAMQPSLPPPSILEGKETPKVAKTEPMPQKSGGSWFDWLRRKGKNEAHLPDDTHKSIVWDEKKQRWVNLDEPEEESKPPPPPPMGFPQVPQAGSESGAPPTASFNIYSRKAGGSRARYVDILNPSGNKPVGAAPAPADLFAPLAPMPISANLLVPNSAAEEQQPLEGKVAEDQVPSGNQPVPEMAAQFPSHLNSSNAPGSELPPFNPDGSQSGEQTQEAPPVGTVQFYNPSQFTQPSASPGGTRLGRIGQRKYPTLK